MKSVTIRQALQQVADYPNPVDDEKINWPVHELVARALFDIANSPNNKVRGGLSRSNKARKMILDRMGGRRRAGTKPISNEVIQVEFIDMTGGEIGESAETAQPPHGGGDPDRATL